MIEKIKKNKLRTVCIGLSAFLFGFITVTLFNSMSNTYAVEYSCKSGWKLVDSQEGICCPEESGLFSGKTKCYIYYGRYEGSHVDECKEKYGDLYLGYNTPNNSCTVNAIYATAVSHCYVCDTTGQYQWATSKPSTSCSGGGWYEKTSITTADNCVAPTYSCWKCDVDNKYVWASSQPSSTCTGINWSMKSGVSQTNCERGNACYFCGNSQGGKYVWGLYGDNTQSCSYQSNINSYSACTAKNIRTISATFNVTDGGTLSGSATAQCTTTQSSPSSCKVTAPNATRSGYYLQGWSTSSSCSAYIGVDDNPSTEDTIYLNNYYQGNLYTCWGTTPPTADNYVPENNVVETPDETVVAYTRPIYTITYDLNGGKFIDGTTSRISYIPADKAIGDPKTNPIKDGMKFKEWQLNGSKFDFSQKPTQNITLKAVYEKLTEEDKLYYCESSSDVLEVSTKTCYNVMKLDESKKLYNYTLYSYTAGGTFCYAYNATNNTPGGVYFRTDVSGYETITGKNNVDYSSYGYPDKEAWVSKDTCLIATECTEAASVNRPACETRWDAIIYSTKSALLKEEKIEEDGTDVPIDDEPIVPDTPSDDEKDNTDKDNNDKDVSESPKTGDALILIAWVVGIGAIGYTVYYFRKRKEN